MEQEEKSASENGGQTRFDNNFSLFGLFVTKDVKIWSREDGKAGPSFCFTVPTMRQRYNDDEISFTVNRLSMTDDNFKDLIPGVPLNNFFDFLNCLFFSEFAGYKEIYGMAQKVKSGLVKRLKGFEIHRGVDDDPLKDVITVGNSPRIIMTSQICEYCQYVLRLSWGQKVSAPLAFKDAQLEKFYQAQKKYDEQIARRRSQAQGEKAGGQDGRLKAFLTIEYRFPCYTHEYLLDQTMAQILWLQKYAAGAVSYEVNAKAFAAGNRKKGTKLDFFIDNK